EGELLVQRRARLRHAQQAEGAQLPQRLARGQLAGVGADGDLVRAVRRGSGVAPFVGGEQRLERRVEPAARQLAALVPRQTEAAAPEEVAHLLGAERSVGAGTETLERAHDPSVRGAFFAGRSSQSSESSSASSVTRSRMRPSENCPIASTPKSNSSSAWARVFPFST